MNKETILSAVLEEHGVTYEEVIKRSRKGILTDIRSQYIYLVLKLIKEKDDTVKWIDVCQYVGYTDHSIYYSALKKANALIDTDAVYRNQISRIRTQLTSQPLKVAVSKI